MRGKWLSDAIDRYGWDIHQPPHCTFENTSTIDLFVGRLRAIKVEYPDKAGLQHDGILVRCRVDECPSMIKPRPNWGKISGDDIKKAIDQCASQPDELLWDTIRSRVDQFPRVRRFRGNTLFWSDQLERMRKDTILARRKNDKQSYGLIRRVYRASLLAARRDHIKKIIETAGDPGIFQLVRKMETRRTLPSMDDNGTLVTTHEGISELISRQLVPGDPTPSICEYIDMGDADELGMAIKKSPKNTGPGFDDIGYPFIRFWARNDPSSLRRLIMYNLCHDTPDWHKAHTVLIEKADKPRYDIVKSWRMIHLLPTIAKVAERIVLIRLAKEIQLEDTQFGSRTGRGVHDSMGVIFEFIKHHQGWQTAMVSMDIEGGFDNIDLDLLLQFMQARGAPVLLCSWVNRWARNRSVRFKFNGRLSKEFFTTRGIPQGSPLSPFLFAIYVADIFRPRIRYTPAVRQVVTSYVDDGVILVATRHRSDTINHIKEIFNNCDRIGRARSMGFSVIKTKWIGFGDTNWGSIDINGIKLEPEEELRILGFYFNVTNNFSSHIRYWLKRGLEVRGRIASMGRRFGDDAGMDAFGTWRLFQAVYLPTIHYGLEWVTDYKDMVSSIQIHSNDALRSLFRMPIRLANNILMSEFSTPPTHIQGRYLQQRCHARMINYRYASQHPWFGEIRSGWSDKSVVPYKMASDQILNRDFWVYTDGDKDSMIQRHLALIQDIYEGLDNVIYTDGSKSSGGCAAGYCIYQKGLTEGGVGIRVPDESSIVEAELFAIYFAMKDLASYYHGPIWVFADCVPALKLLDSMLPEGTSAGLWDMMVPVINQFSKVWFEWVPAHVGITGNHLADHTAKKAVGGNLSPLGWNDFSMGIGQNATAREDRKKSWINWHRLEGHDYYDRLPGNKTHLKGLTRLDKFILVRVRTGTDHRSHRECSCGLHEQRYHLLDCPLLADQRPPKNLVFNDKSIPLWIKWWQSHNNFGFGIPTEHANNDDVVTLCGNPFNSTVTVLENGILTMRAVAKHCSWCDNPLGKRPMHCSRPIMRLPNKWYWIQTSHDKCHYCYKQYPIGAIRAHFRRNPDCIDGTFRRFWDDAVERMNTMDDLEERSIVIARTLQTQDSLRCRCGYVFANNPSKSNHLRMRVGWNCYEFYREIVWRWATRRGDG